MNQEDYDAIVIGAGLGGLMAAAGLIKTGKRVLILEKATFIGGKYTEFDYKGYKVTTGAWTSMGKNSHIDRFCREVGADIKYITLKEMQKKGGSGLLGKLRYKNGKEYMPTSTQNTPLSELEMQEFTKLMMGLAAKELKGMDRSKNISMRQYAKNFTKSEKIIRILNSIIGTASGLDVDTIPASEFKIILDEGFGLTSGKFGFPAGGTKSIINALEKVIKDNGGLIKTRCNVNKIYIDDNSATGVELSSGESISSDIVIHNAGPKMLLDLGGINNFPSEFVKRIKSFIPVQALAIILGLNNPISTDVPMIFTPDCERITGIFEPTFFDSSIAPPGKSMIDVFCPLKSKNIKKETDIAIKDLQDLYPNILDPSNLDFQQNMAFYGEFPAAEAAQALGQVGDDRIDPKLPVKNLFLVGAEAKGSGVAGDLIPLGVRKALNLILKTDNWLKIPI